MRSGGCPVLPYVMCRSWYDSFRTVRAPAQCSTDSDSHRNAKGSTFDIESSYTQKREVQLISSRRHNGNAARTLLTSTIVNSVGLCLCQAPRQSLARGWGRPTSQDKHRSPSSSPATTGNHHSCEGTIECRMRTRKADLRGASERVVNACSEASGSDLSQSCFGRRALSEVRFG